MEGPALEAEELAAIMRGLPVGVCAYDRHRRIVHLNPLAEEIVGYRLAEVRQRPCAHIIRHGMDNQHGQEKTLCLSECPLDDCLIGGEPSPTLRLNVNRRGSARATYLCRFAPVRDAQGAIVGVVETMEPVVTGSLNRTDLIVLGDLEIDLTGRSVRRGGIPVKLTKTEYQILAHLALNLGDAVSHAELLRAVWGPQCEEETQYLHSFIAQLRRKIERNPRRPQHVITEPRFGYRLTAFAPRRRHGEAFLAEE